MNHLRVVLAVGLALVATSVRADNDAANGRLLYLGLPSASHPAGSTGCNSCHNVNDTSIQQNRLFRSAAGDPALIEFAINTNPSSVPQMRPLFGAGAPFELSTSDRSDLAAYIDTVVNPGGATAPAFAAAPASASFGSIAVGLQSAPMTFTISNSGAAGSIDSVSSSNNSEFLLAGGTCLATPISLAQNASCTVDVVFAPTVSGARISTVTLIDDGTPNPLTISLAGDGAGASGGPGTRVSVVEFYNAGFDHYFITPVAGEIGALGKPPFDDWQPTGRSFNAYANAGAPAGTVPICRFFNDHFAPKSTHFYAAHGLGCEDVIAGFPDWTLEDAQLFNMLLPDANGNCPANSIPVYRLYNDGMGGAPNHRFVTAADDRQAMVARGYVSEGFGALGVGMCSPV